MNGTFRRFATQVYVLIRKSLLAHLDDSNTKTLSCGYEPMLILVHKVNPVPLPFKDQRRIREEVRHPVRVEVNSLTTLQAVSPGLPNLFPLEELHNGRGIPRFLK